MHTGRMSRCRCVWLKPGGLGPAQQRWRRLGPAMAENDQKNRLKELERNVDKAFARIKDLEADVKEAKELLGATAKLAALTSRDTEELKSKFTVTCWLSGTFKDTAKAGFQRYQEAGKAEREAAKREGRKTQPQDPSWKQKFGQYVANWV